MLSEFRNFNDLLNYCQKKNREEEIEIEDTPTETFASFVFSIPSYQDSDNIFNFARDTDYCSNHIPLYIFKKFCFRDDIFSSISDPNINKYRDLNIFIRNTYNNKDSGIYCLINTTFFLDKLYKLEEDNKLLNTKFKSVFNDPYYQLLYVSIPLGSIAYFMNIYTDIRLRSEKFKLMFLKKNLFSDAIAKENNVLIKQDFALEDEIDLKDISQYTQCI